MRQLGWCTGKTHGEGMGREEGEGSGWATHINPWLSHVNVWQKPLQYCKIISLQLIKINENKQKKTLIINYLLELKKKKKMNHEC